VARPFFISILAMFCLACETNDAIERIPGTERAAVKSAPATAGSGNSISISPDEKWLLFWEWIATPLEYRDHEDGVKALAMKPVSINLETLVRSDHSRDRLPRPRFSYTYDWENLGGRFRPEGWYDGKFYIEMRPLQDVVFDPLQEQLKASPMPDVVFGCSDCPPPRLFREAVRKIGGRSSESYIQYYTAAWHNGRMSETMYRAKSEGVVEEIKPDGTITVLFQKQIRGRFTTVKRLRVSPDETYLVYSVYSKLRAPIPLPGGREDIYIRHLPTGEEKKIVSYSAAGNFMWSPDSKRLYFAARRSGFKEMGVYRMHVEKLFH
jgi:hypothetical protein